MVENFNLTYPSVLTTLRALKEVKDTCFGQLESHFIPITKDVIENFGNDIYVEFGINFTNKVQLQIFT